MSATQEELKQIALNSPSEGERIAATSRIQDFDTLEHIKTSCLGTKQAEVAEQTLHEIYYYDDE